MRTSSRQETYIETSRHLFEKGKKRDTRRGKGGKGRERRCGTGNTVRRQILATKKDRADSKGRVESSLGIAKLGLRRPFLKSMEAERMIFEQFEIEVRTRQPRSLHNLSYPIGIRKPKVEKEAHERRKAPTKRPISKTREQHRQITKKKKHIRGTKGQQWKEH